MSRKVETVIVVGRDAAAWLAALSLDLAFGPTGVKVKVVELPSLLQPEDCYTGLPTLAGLHGLLGLQEKPLLKACSGTHSYGQRFSGWSGEAPPFMHAYDVLGTPINNVDFIHYWLKARAQGLGANLEEFSLGAVAARENRFVLHGDGTFSSATYGFHLEARHYAQSIKLCALKAGVEHVEAELDVVDFSGERINSIILKNKKILEGDLFIDATGSEAALIGQMPGSVFEPWDRWLACDRIMVSSAKRLSPLPSYAQINACKAGWVGLFPLRDRTAVVAGYASSACSDEEMAGLVPRVTGLPLEGGAVASAFKAGARLRPWAGNCIALGEAAVSLEPLDAVPLHLTHVGISNLVANFPVNADDLREARLYNEAMLSHARNVRDFQIAHYKLNQRTDGELWQQAREMEVPDSLAYKMDLFGARGRVPIYDNEAFQEENWTASFIGHGLIPRQYDPLADMLPAQEHMERFQRMLQYIGSEVRRMPSQEAHLELDAPVAASSAPF